MIVEVKHPNAFDVVTKEPNRDVGVYFIYVDDQFAGTIGYRPEIGSPCLHRRYSPMELEEIRKQVAEKLEVETVETITQAPEKLPEKSKRGKVADDFAD